MRIRSFHPGTVAKRSVILALLSFTLLPAALTQSVYHDPKGRYELLVPDGWHVTPDEGVDQVIVKSGAVQATIAVIQQNKSNAMTAKEFLEGTEKEFQGQCPTFEARNSGTTSLAGEPAIYGLFTCSDPKSPAVAETSSVLTKNLMLVGFTMIAPLNRYYAALPVLDSIRLSLHLTGQSSPPAATKPEESLPISELMKACAVGIFSQEDCARRHGILLSQDAPADPASTKELYRDPQGRFTVQVPEGWKAISEGKDGVLGVQLREGSDWINIMPASNAQSASEVVLHQEQKVAEQSHLDRKPPFGISGVIQIFGHGNEVAFDDFDGSTPQGEAATMYIAGVGDISGQGQSYLLMVASMGKTHAEKAGGIFLAAAQSIQLPTHRP